MFSKKIKIAKPNGRAVAAFLVTLSLCSAVTVITVYNRLEVERLVMEQMITQKGMQIRDVVSKLLYKTQTLSALVVQNNGLIDDFEKVANTIVDDPVILNVLLAPDGVVTDVYPKEGNESVLGWDFFAEGGNGNKEAIKAKELGDLVLGGPFNVVQGGQALVGRLPLFIDTASGGKEFWGLVSVTLKYPQVLTSVGLDTLQTQGLAFELWRINPDDGEKQIIARSEYGYKQNARFLERQISISNADWYFRILPIRSWYEYSEAWILIFASIVLCFLIAVVIHNNHVLINLKSRLEVMACEDSLTGIHNRRFFLELAAKEYEKLSRNDSKAFIIIFDLDYFKDINDRYGHAMGDRVLISVARNVKSMMRTYDLFARYGGEEFIILVTDIEKDSVLNLCERLRKRISETIVESDGTQVTVSASFGIAAPDKKYDIENTIRMADEALYMAKRDGRNRAVYYEKNE